MAKISGWEIIVAVALGLGILAQASSGAGQGKVFPLIPWPVEVSAGAGEYALTAGASLRFGSGAADAARLLQADLQHRTGIELSAQATPELPETTMVISSAAALALEPVSLPEPPEAYQLKITASAVVLSGRDRGGALWAGRTLLQLLRRQGEQWVFPAVTIRDYPRFPRRSLLLDPARDFISLEGLKRIVELLAEFKFNVLHLHLTDDQGWRFESKAFPRLQEVGGEGKFYTQEQLRELAAYAEVRGVTVMPEIDMPGHVTALLAAYPELSCSGRPVQVSHHLRIYPNALCPAKEEVYAFIKTVLGEVAAVFPGEFIHIGSDEVVAKDWENCPECERLLAGKNPAGKTGLHAYFISRVDEILAGYGKKMLAWDEVTEFAPPDVVIQAWRKKSWAGVAAGQGRRAVSTPNLYTYLDHRFLLPLWLAYRLEPIPAGLTLEQEKLILGGGANLWGVFAPEARLDKLLFPKLLALAEVYWSPKEARDFCRFRRRLAEVRPGLRARGVKFKQ